MTAVSTGRTGPAPTLTPTARAPEFTPAPLGAWGKTWRALVAIGTGLIGLLVATSQMPVDRMFLVGVDLIFGMILIVLMFFRRRWPFPIALVSTILGWLSGLGLGALTIIIISLATRRRWREVVPVGILFISGGWLYDWLYYSSDASPLWVEFGDPGVVEGQDAAGGTLPWWATMLVGLLFFAVLAAIGFYIGARRELIATLQARVETAEREQFARADQARTAERSRIAREMHDVLAHRISLVAMHSGALAYRTDLTREETASAAEIVRDNAHLALTELREVLGVLRDSDGERSTPDRPQPTLASLDELVEQTSIAGTKTTITIAPQIAEALTGLPETTSRTAYRILQEALTNVRKHAPAAAAQVLLGGSPGDRFTIEVRNPVARESNTDDVRWNPPTSGMGLTGLTERATLASGELTHGIDRAGDFVVRAWLPWAN